jgi:hypothetical protein
MTRSKLAALSVAELVERFVSIAHDQVQAERAGRVRQMRTHYWRMDSVREELRRRPGDQRSALIPLLRHPEAQVRLKAAVSTLALAPDEARMTLQSLADRGLPPQALYAGVALNELDLGNFKPT